MENKPLPPTEVARASPTRPVPLDFNIYSESATSAAVYFMGPHRVDRQFALTLCPNSIRCMPEPFIILHDGLTQQAPALGTSTNVSPLHGQSWVKFAITITISGLPSSEGILEYIQRGTQWRPEFFFRYAVETGADGSMQQEFEWHETNSAEIQRLSGASNGWRLFAVGNESETLAVCAPNGGSLTKFFRFAFRGKGRTADTGPRWKLMAILTAITVWQRGSELASRMG